MQHPMHLPPADEVEQYVVQARRRVAAGELGEIDEDALTLELVGLLAIDGQQRGGRRDGGVATDLGDVGGQRPERERQRPALGFVRTTRTPGMTSRP